MNGPINDLHQPAGMHVDFVGWPLWFVGVEWLAFGAFVVLAIVWVFQRNRRLGR